MPNVGRVRRVRAVAVIDERVSAVEPGARERLLVEEPALGVAERDVVLPRHRPLHHPVEHGYPRPSRCCSRSIDSKSARKLPAPNPSSPLRWMISKKNGPASFSW